MTISYNWLNDFLPKKIEPEELSAILTSIGLEVESLEKYEEFKGGLEGLVVGEVVECEKHPGADKLSLTKVNIGQPELLNIVCGAPNVAKGQKVIVAPVGSTIYPVSGEPIRLKAAKIRGEESQGMICAADEIGLSDDHSGIFILPETLLAGTSAAEFFRPYSDYIFEIGLTPNRMDAMSHMGVARDILAWLKHHKAENQPLKYPSSHEWKAPATKPDIDVIIKDTDACQRYAGVKISGIKVGPSPQWMQQRLKSIGLRPINNIVDITNYILHETGQPLHAFDTSAIKQNKVLVQTLAEGTSFITLDEKERKLSSSDLMICNGAGEPMCIGGVFGGLKSGVTENTTDIFLESAWFNPISIRRSSLKHGLRTDAASRFEKGVDISQTVIVLKRAVLLIAEITGGKIASDVVDVYPKPKEKNSVKLDYAFLQKLSGKTYSPENVHGILEALGFIIVSRDEKSLTTEVPFNKPDITIPADLLEEVMRIDGLDNVEIPQSISITPAIDHSVERTLYREKLANLLMGKGFSEIFTNSITNSAYYADQDSAKHLKLLNNLSAELDMLRPSMLETGLEALAYNINRQNRDLLFFEFGKIYSGDRGQGSGDRKFLEEEQLCLYVTGDASGSGWRSKGQNPDLFYLKGICTSLLHALNINNIEFKSADHNSMESNLTIWSGKTQLAFLGSVKQDVLSGFSIKQPVYFADFLMDVVEKIAGGKIQYNEIPKYPSVHRDLSILVSKNQSWEQIEKLTVSAKLDKLKNIKLFDIFEHEKLGAGKRSFAIHYTFLDPEKTLTDKETDSMMNRIAELYEKELGAEIRKS